MTQESALVMGGTDFLGTQLYGYLLENDVDFVYDSPSRTTPKDFEDYPIEITLITTQGAKYFLEHAAETNATLVLPNTSEVSGEHGFHSKMVSNDANVNNRGEQGCESHC